MWNFKLYVFLLIGIASCNTNLNNPLPQDITNDFEKLVKHKCKERGGAAAYKNLQDSVQEINDYITKNFEKIEDEIEVAKNTGSMDDVFKKYCDLKTETLKYVHKISNNFLVCLSDEEKPTVQLALNITEGLLDFACYHDGERIALFIAEDGSKCINDNNDALQECIRNIVGNQIPSTSTFDKFPVLIVTKDKCEKYKKVETCIVQQLEQCSDLTPSNVIESVSKYIYNLSPCPTL